MNSLGVKPIDPSLYLHRFASQMDFGDQTNVCPSTNEIMRIESHLNGFETDKTYAKRLDRSRSSPSRYDRFEDQNEGD